jgi:thioredoxin-like negative regulator of GroEL
MNFYQILKEHFGLDSERKALYRKVDWFAMGLTFLIAFIGYLITLAPDLTLEDSGELAVGSYYAGVPHPPGYPVWTIYSWLFTVLVPISNVAYRVAVSSAFASALSCGLIALLISRGASLILESIPELKELDRKMESKICAISGFVGGLLFGYNGFVWSQSVIVEVYTLSVLSLLVVMVFMMRWMYAPIQRHYLYLAMFIFGICFTNHQTLIVAALGIEMMVILISPTLGREMLMGNSIIFLFMLMGAVSGKYENLSPERPIFKVFVAVGILSIIGYIFLAIKNKYEVRSWWHNLTAGIISAFAWLLGNVFYFFMPISSMTNPPMNWGYARTVKGFFHALTRGQYESAKPTSDLLSFFDQLRFYVSGAMEEFSLVILLLALIPFAILFYMKMDSVHKKRILWVTIAYSGLFLLGLLTFWSNQVKGANIDVAPIRGYELFLKLRGATVGFAVGWLILLLVATPFIFFKDISGKIERSWIAGTTGVFFCLAIILLILLNPSSDKQSQELHKVFFTSSYVFFAMWIGYGISLTLAFLFTRYQLYREAVMFGSAVASGLALYGLAVTLTESRNPSFIATAILGLLITLALIVLLFMNRKTPPAKALLILMLFIPVHTVMGHWWDNEQRGHLFGFWYGHDMFTPPFEDKDGKPLYPEMTKNAVLFGGTDPGRFCPTYMIFCESQIPPQKRRDPNFDRRDVYIITQNALADQTYLDYIRAHYFRSNQEDTNFFQVLFPSKAVGWMTQGLDKFFLDHGKKVENRRREQGVYPPKEIYTPSDYDFFVSGQEYCEDVRVRYEKGQLKAGESYNPKTGEVGLSGQAAVMGINGFLAKIIFDKNPDHEFFIEESFPLDWMYPYLTPYGIIMKINREPVAKFTPEIIVRDQEFWGQYMNRLIGNWITYETSLDDICDFALEVYLRGNFKGYRGDMKFLRDDDAQKSFSKLRSAITGLYWWRANSTTSAEEQQLLLREAEFSAKQAYALCPFSPEALYKLVNMLVLQNRFDDSINLIMTSMMFDSENDGLKDLLAQVKTLRDRSLAEEAKTKIQPLEQAYLADTNNYSNAISLAAQYLEAKRVVEAQSILLSILPQLQKLNNEKPDNPEIALNLFAVYTLTSQPEPAKEVIKNLLASGKASLATVIASAQALLQQGFWEETEATLAMAVAMAPGNAEILYDLAAMQSILNKSDLALSNLNQAIEFNKAQRGTNQNIQDLLNVVLPQDRRFDPIRKSPLFPKN